MRDLGADLTMSIVIAVDGTAASGKGTLAKKLARHFHFAHLDSGSLYRLVALAVQEAGGDLAKEERCSESGACDRSHARGRSGDPHRCHRQGGVAGFGASRRARGPAASSSATSRRILSAKARGR